ncbi:uncharacterized protein LOC121737170 [Aricia agestis]|uniref:uncharacterized protein LOC121737170 n=1 Tax=Aricia agestis TaxID=91739 RepID=UPI001C2099FD|nr:uncharacterized protein LOC121737170 [Aricia agestis]
MNLPRLLFEYPKDESLQPRETRQLAIKKINLSTLSCGCPLVRTSEGLINYIIRNKWKLADNFMYCVEYRGNSTDEAASYCYFEAIFSQPTPAYPIPQITVSVFFRVRQSHLESPSAKETPTMTWRLEGHRQDHDASLELLTEPRIIAVMMMKRNLFRRVEELGYF